MKGYRGMNRAKTVITGIVGVPAVLILLSEVEDLRLIWVQLLAIAIVLALVAWWGLLRRTKYDSNGFAIEEANRLPARRIGNPNRVTAAQRAMLDNLEVELNEEMKGATA